MNQIEDLFYKVMNSLTESDDISCCFNDANFEKDIPPHNERFFERARQNNRDGRSVPVVREDHRGHFNDANFEKDPLLCVATSGGSDSLALTFLAKKWADLRQAKVTSVTIDHRLRKESADEAEFVHTICSSLGIYHETIAWEHHDIPQGQIETEARKARYKTLADFCLRHGIKYILTGHTLDDQLETYCIRTKMGSGYIGLSGISAVRHIENGIKLLRPCLLISKEQLRKYLYYFNGISFKKDIPPHNERFFERARQNNRDGRSVLDVREDHRGYFNDADFKKDPLWIEDSMNYDPSYMRVLERNQIAKMTEKDKEQIILEISNNTRRRIDLEKRTVDFLKQYLFISNMGFASLPVDKLSSTSLDIQVEAIKRIIKLIGGMEYVISDTKCENLINSRYTGNTGRAMLRKKGKVLYICRENRNIDITPISSHKPILWDQRFAIKTDAIGGEIRALGTYKNIENIPSYITVSLPSLWINGRLTSNFGEIKSHTEHEHLFECEFLLKDNFLDVFSSEYDSYGVIL